MTNAPAYRKRKGKGPGPTRDEAGAWNALIIVKRGVVQPRLGQARVVRSASPADFVVTEPVPLAPGIQEALLEASQLHPAHKPHPLLRFLI